MTTICAVAPGDVIELRRLPGVQLEVAAVWKRESFGDREVFMVELLDETGGKFFLRPDDEREALLSICPCPSWEEPQSPAILEGE